MVFWEYKTKLFSFLSVTEATDVVVDSIAVNFWGSEDELTSVLSDEVES